MSGKTPLESGWLKWNFLGYKHATPSELELLKSNYTADRKIVPTLHTSTTPVFLCAKEATLIPQANNNVMSGTTLESAGLN